MGFHFALEESSIKVKKNLRESQAQFLEKLRKLRLRKNDDFLIKKNEYALWLFIVTCHGWISGLIQDDHLGVSDLLSSLMCISDYDTVAPR